MIKTLHRWTRLSSTKWEDAWEERLRFIDPQHLAFVTWPGSRSLKIEAYCDEKTANALIKRFGGKSTKVAAKSWIDSDAKVRPPLAIRTRLKVYSDEASWKEAAKTKSKTDGIFLPAGMAFGTGEHATTATCLRFLCDMEATLPKDFTVLDLGTGSGLLAIAAEKLGASAVDAIDYDDIAVKVAKRNVTKNRCKLITCFEGNALELKTKSRYHVVLANLYSDVLISAAPRIAKTLKPGGTLIFSGVLRSQAPEVAAAFQAEGLSAPQITARGKWCAGICKKPC